MNTAIHYDIRSHLENNWPQLASHEVERLTEEIFIEWDDSLIAQEIDAAAASFCSERDIPLRPPLITEWEPR